MFMRIKVKIMIKVQSFSLHSFSCFCLNPDPAVMCCSVVTPVSVLQDVASHTQTHTSSYVVRPGEWQQLGVSLIHSTVL